MAAQVVARRGPRRRSALLSVARGSVRPTRQMLRVHMRNLHRWGSVAQHFRSFRSMAALRVPHYQAPAARELPLRRAGQQPSAALRCLRLCRLASSSGLKDCSRGSSGARGSCGARPRRACLHGVLLGHMGGVRLSRARVVVRERH